MSKANNKKRIKGKKAYRDSDEMLFYFPNHRKSKNTKKEERKKPPRKLEDFN